MAPSPALEPLATQSEFTLGHQSSRLSQEMALAAGEDAALCVLAHVQRPPHGPLFTSERSTREFLQKHGRVVKLGEPVLRIWHLGGYPDVFIFRNHKPFRSFPHQFHAKLASCRASPLRPGRDDLGSGSNWGCHLGPTGIR